MLMYGEHLGDPPWKMYYVDAGMRIANDDFLNAVKGNIGSSLSAWIAPPTPSSTRRPVHALRDESRQQLPLGGDREQAHAVLLAREGEVIVYTDGYNRAGRRTDSRSRGGAVPRQFGRPIFQPARYPAAVWLGYQSAAGTPGTTRVARYDPSATGGAPMTTA